MSIPAPYSSRYIYHFTHIDNLPEILQTGFLANNHPNFPIGRSTSIAAATIQERRASMGVPCGAGGVVHDYVPLYFGSLSPMLLGVVNKKNIDQFDIVYFEFPISMLSRVGAVFTDASANTTIPPNFYNDVKFLKNLNWKEIDSLKWSSASEDLRHQRMAEVLIPQTVEVQAATRVIVWNKSARERVQRIVNEAGVNFPPIQFENPQRRHYFTKIPPAPKDETLVTGPKGIAFEYASACAVINDTLRQEGEFKFSSPKALLDGLRADFGCIPHTAELIGLKSENGVHRKTVDAHTLEVVQKLLSLDEFKKLDPVSRGRTELAAYLHDIGKGPKSRWKYNGGIQKVDPDHPVGAMPMMVEIFLSHIEHASVESVNVILKMICYHDLVGEVLGKERDEQQIIDVADSLLELDMLFAIGKADATALSEKWWNQIQANALYDRCKKAILVKVQTVEQQ